MSQALYESSIQSLPLLGRGKVRDIYAIDAEKLLIVTSDRLSAFDVVLPDPIPSKGKVLTQMANFWFEKLDTSAGIENSVPYARANGLQVRCVKQQGR